MREGEKVKTVSNLAGVFMGGRISGWVIRNRELLEGECWDEVEVDLLLVLSPVFAEDTDSLVRNERVQLVITALALADERPLSATRLVV